MTALDKVNKSVLGVIGGIGPLATAYFLELIVTMTDAELDQEHLEVIIYNSPSIPDRTSYIFDKSKGNPIPPMISIGEKLKAQGSKYIAIPCITAHSFLKELKKGIDLPIIDMMKETANCLKENKISSIGLMATDGTLKAGTFKANLEREGFKVITPSPIAQSFVMELIYKEIMAVNAVDIQKCN